MRKGASRNVSQCRLFALLLSVLLFVGTESSHDLPSISSSHLPSEFTQPFARRYRLYSRCSHRHIQIRYNRRAVNARGIENSPYARLLVETVDNKGRITIKSEETGRYLCFNRRGILIARHHGNKAQCMFFERIDDENYTKLQSAASDSWYVGFRKNGKALLGRQYDENRHNCFQFLKRENTAAAKKVLSNGPDGLNKAHFEHFLQKDKLSRKRSETRKNRKTKQSNSRKRGKLGRRRKKPRPKSWK